VWIVPSTTARDQVIRALGLRVRLGRVPRVWTWDDLWREVREASPTGPALLSEAAARAVLGAAIARAGADGVLGDAADLVGWPGFRRRLRARIAAWTRAGRRPGSAPPGDPAQAASWAIFARYRAVLKRLDAEDAEGFAAWASRRLAAGKLSTLGLDEAVTFLDPGPDCRASWRVLEHAHETAEMVGVTLAYDPEPALAEAFADAAATRHRLVDEWGFAETIVPPLLGRRPPPEGSGWLGSRLRDPGAPATRNASEPGLRQGIPPSEGRPEGLVGVERELFRSDSHQRPPLDRADGLTIAGAPQGDGVGLVVAREVKGLLSRGIDPEEVLVLVRRWDEDAEVVLDTLRAWGLPVAAAPPRSLATSPAVAALLLAARVPVEGWETEHLIRLLRNGQVRPSWCPSDVATAVAASALQASRAFRGLEAIRRVLDIDRRDAKDDPRRLDRARLAFDVVKPLLDHLATLDRARPWREQADALRALAGVLGLGLVDDGLDAFLDALDDHGAVLDRLGAGDRARSWAAFVREVVAMAGEVALPAPIDPEGAVRMAAVDEVVGARASHVVLANLGEGSFPTREAIDPRLALAADEDRPDVAFGREMGRFLRTVGSAERGLVLAYPTGDEHGQELLRAGFLDDLLGRLSPEAERACHTSHRRLDPALIDRPDLAGAAADARVRAVARACVHRDPADLVALAGLPSQRAALDGVAAALRVLHERTRAAAFGPYDGLLRDPEAIRRIAEDFGPEHTLSPSQLETFLFCPFQFFLRYVLRLEPVDERDEIEEDYTGRGIRIHRILEELERLRTQEEESRLALAEGTIRRVMDEEPGGGSDVEAGLHRIDQGRLGRAVRRYARQHQSYEETAAGLGPSPHLFEVVFGEQEDDPASYPSLVLGDGPAAVRLQGKIDRVDLLSGPGGRAFRVIDYKTGSCPSKKDVKEALYLQLPLYAMAVERLVLAREPAALHDVGYWALAGKGFAPIALKEWAQARDEIEAFVVRVVGQLRGGAFPVDSRKPDCARRCEYGCACRVGEVRAGGKARDDAPRLEIKA
jgi:ATP-dependent helicase/nuclease subunit B